MGDRGTWRGPARVIASAALGLVLLPVAINLATDGDAPLWAVPAVAVLGISVILLTVGQYRADRRTEPGGRFPAAFREKAIRSSRSVLDARLAYRPENWAGFDLVAAPERVRPPADLTVVDVGAGQPQRIPDAFERASRSLLLLGAPGAGKTTQLLDLADRLLTAAEEDGTQPIPVLLDLGTFRPTGTLPRPRGSTSADDQSPGRRLSAWRGLLRRGDTVEDQQPDSRWLLRALRRQYGLGGGVAREWLAEHRLVLLLDGLDEVPPAHRGRCVRWINELQETYRVPPMVVCARDAEYTETAPALAVQHAVLIAPLDRARVTVWLADGGPALAHVRDAIDADPTLWELLDAPLWLDVLAAVSGSSRAESPDRSVASRRRALMDAYIDEATRRGDQSAGYTRAQVTRWLSRLAAPGAPVVATTRALGLVDIDGKVPQDARITLALPAMAIVGLVGAAALWWHAGPVTAAVAAGVALFTVFVWSRTTERPSERTTARPGRYLAILPVGVALAALAAAAAAVLTFLVGLIPRIPDSNGPGQRGSIDWLEVLAVGAVALAVAAGLGLAWTVAITVSGYRAGGRPARPVRHFAVTAGLSTALVIGAVLFFGYWIGFAYLILVYVPAEYTTTALLTAAFVTVGGAVGIATAAVSEDGVQWERREEHWVPTLGLAAMVVALAVVAAHVRAWIAPSVSYHLTAVGTGTFLGLYLAAQFRRPRLRVPALTALCLAAGDHLPWRLTRFLRYAAHRSLLREEGKTFRFRHQLFAEHFTGRAKRPWHHAESDALSGG